MLPPALAGSYRRYKEDTDSVAAWLASTAKFLGYSSDLLDNGTANKTTTTGRAKGKARIQAKKQQRKPAKSPPTAKKYTIKINDFIPLAEFIADKPTASVPDSLKTTLSRVISIRSGFRARLEKHGVLTDEEAALSHDFFLGVLEKVQEVLKLRMTPSSTKAAAGSSSPAAGGASVESLVSPLETLKVYEPSDEFLNAPDIERPKKMGDDDAIYETEPQNSIVEVLTYLSMLANDVSRIRSYVRWIWDNHKKGLFDLATAAVTTNTAIDLARNLMDDIEPMFKEHGGIWQVLNKLYLVQAMARGYNISDIYLEGSDDNFNYDTYDVANDTFILTCRLLEAFTRVVQPGSIPLYKDGMFGFYNPRRDRSSMTGYQKFSEDRVLIMTFFTELMAIERGIDYYPVEDEFLRGVKELDRTKEVPFYLVFAAQVYLDIHYVLRDQAELPFDILMKNLEFFHNEIGEHFKFHENLKIDHWPAANDYMVRHMQTKIKHIMMDPVYKVKVKAYQSVGQPVPTSMQPNRILKMSPVLSGLMLYHFRAEMWDIGIAISNAWGSITYSLHLYNALRSEKLIARSWPDMDVVELVLRESNFFVGDSPRSPDEYYRRFCLQMGTTAAAFTNKRRRNVALASRSGPRGIKEGAPVSCMFMDRYLRGTGQVDWTPEHVAKIIDLGLWEMEGSAEEGTLMMGQIDDPEKLKEKKKNGMKKKKAAEDVQAPPEQLVRALTFALQAESLEFSLPYLAMHRECWSYLRAVRKRCDPLLRQIFTPAYMERETELPFVVGWIFSAAAESKDMRLLSQAAEATSAFTRTDGSTLVEALDALGFPVEMEIERA
ncbi:hypothetical protein F4779DRAFT_592862 [Xylariaceae sp. FL0662B]|nr:hypothetical protein F4779DRAFT_592862 [Xylariaceae sp. FL0662B]